MHHSFAPTKRSLFKLVLCTAAAALMLALMPAGAGAAGRGQIEGFPNYRPQTTCSPKPKRGTVMLANYLMRHYRGSGSLGISRSCGASGVSEHKEGRAFDWALDARSARDRHYAADFLHRLRKSDRAGHKDALARRMGIMYVIWNDHIYSATYHYKKQRYLNAACRNLKHCSVSLRHRNHMHISLTRAAARGQTSWYEARGAAPAHKAHHKAHKSRHRAHHKAHHRAHHKHHRAHHKAHHRKHRAHHHRAHPRRHHHLGHHRRRHHHVHHAHHRRHHRHHHRHHRRHHRARFAGRLTTQQPYDGQQISPEPTVSPQTWSNATDWSEDAQRTLQTP